MSSSSTSTVAAAPVAADTAAMSVVEVPANLDFDLNANLGKVLYDNLVLENMVGNIQVKKRKVDMTNYSIIELKEALLATNFSGYRNQWQNDNFHEHR